MQVKNIYKKFYVGDYPVCVCVQYGGKAVSRTISCMANATFLAFSGIFIQSNDKGRKNDKCRMRKHSIIKKISQRCDFHLILSSPPLFLSMHSIQSTLTLGVVNISMQSLTSNSKSNNRFSILINSDCKFAFVSVTFQDWTCQNRFHWAQKGLRLLFFSIFL